MSRSSAIPTGTVAEQLKEMADEVHARMLKAWIPDGPDTWTTVEVHHASLYSDSPDGWDVVVEQGGL